MRYFHTSALVLGFAGCAAAGLKRGTGIIKRVLEGTPYKLEARL
jgi:hypothetical protein